jgi:O-antigen/teichoic acid export membrane protein
MEKIKNFFFKNTSDKQTVIKNTFWLTFSEVVGRLLKMVLIIYMARKLGTDQWGIFSYAISMGSLLMIFSDIGISNLLTREVVQKKEEYEQFISTALFLKIIILLISTVLMVVVSPFLSNIREANKIFAIIAIILFFDSLTNLGLALNRAFEKMEREVIIKTISNTVVLILGITLLNLSPTSKSVAVAYAIGSAISSFLIFLMLKDDIKKFIIKIDTKKIGLILQTTWPFAIIILIGSIMANIDTFMLGIWKNPKEIGLYAVAQRFYQLIIIIPSVVSTATFPIMSRLTKSGDKQQSTSVLERTLVFIMMLGIPIAAGGIILANQLIPLVFGIEYIEAVPLLQILMLMLLVSFPITIMSNTIFSHNKQRDLATAYIAGIIFNILINILLIPSMGAKGAALATLISTTIITAIIWIKIKHINNFKIFSKLKTIFLATLLMGLLTLVLKYLGINVMLNIMTSSLVYLILLMILREQSLIEIRELINI